MHDLVNSSRPNDVKLTLASFCQAKSFYFNKEYGDDLYHVNCAVSSKLQICILCHGHSVGDQINNILSKVDFVRQVR